MLFAKEIAEHKLSISVPPVSMNIITQTDTKRMTDRVRIAISAGQRELAYGYLAELMIHLKQRDLPLEDEPLELYSVLLLGDIATEAKLSLV